MSWISKLSHVTLAGIFKFLSKFLSTLQTRNHEVNRQMDSTRFSLSAKRNYVVEEFSARHQRAIISWDQYLITSPPKVRR